MTSEQMMKDYDSLKNKKILVQTDSEVFQVIWQSFQINSVNFECRMILNNNGYRVIVPANIIKSIKTL